MRAAIDRRVSRRDVDSQLLVRMAALREKRDALDEELERMDEYIAAMQESPRYKLIVERSAQRLEEITRKNIEVDPSDLLAHAEIIGQYNERLLITQELLGEIENRRKKFQGLVDIGRRLEVLAKRLQH